MTNIPATPEEWITFARILADTVDKEMDEYDTLNPKQLIQKLPIILSLVNSIASIRWQNSFFLRIRPAGTSQFQWELYQLEQRATERFNKILNHIKKAWLTNEARKELNSYLVDFCFPIEQK